MITEFSGPYQFLSNFTPARVTLDNEVYPNVEAAFQAAKTTDKTQRKAFQNYNGAQAKKAGRQLKIRPDWEQVKLNIMEELVREKFTDPELRQKLLDTKDTEIIEGNYWGDTFWGVCRGTGQNHLGKIIQKIRTEIQKQNKI